ncbi:MAG: protein-glutamate O-methyltransferase CheR [Pseudomonadota bacterium]
MSPAPQSITLSDRDFRQIAELAATEAGLAIPESKKSLVQSRVARRMRLLGFRECGEYLTAITGNETETQQLIAALTTNVSHFFREKHHFDYVRDVIQNAAPTDKLRFWSAGCSNGQEPYSLAMEVLKALPNAAEQDILILASDIDRNVLDKATRGVYSASEVEGVPPRDRAAFLQEQPDGTYQVIESLRKIVRFRQLNLNGKTWPMKGPFDAIFCRNVVIYFNDETQANLWPRFHALLRPGGLLILGHSERLQPIEDSGFETAGVTTYRKL